jgi:hypothetical protein
MADKLAWKTEMAWKTVEGESVKKQNVRGANETEIADGLNQCTKAVGRYHLDWTWRRDNMSQELEGHIVVVERFENGGLRIYDPQAGECLDWKELSSNIDITKGINILRVDNLIPDEGIVKGIVHKR